jgi:hypothetical protein
VAVVQRFLQPPAGSFFLFGPRGSGKSTWLQQAFPDALRLNLLAPEGLRSLQARKLRHGAAELGEGFALSPALEHGLVPLVCQAAAGATPEVFLL